MSVACFWRRLRDVCGGSHVACAVRAVPGDQTAGRATRHQPAQLEANARPHRQGGKGALTGGPARAAAFANERFHAIPTHRPSSQKRLQVALFYTVPRPLPFAAWSTPAFIFSIHGTWPTEHRRSLSVPSSIQPVHNGTSPRQRVSQKTIHVFSLKYPRHHPPIISPHSYFLYTDTPHPP